MASWICTRSNGTRQSSAPSGPSSWIADRVARLGDEAEAIEGAHIDLHDLAIVDQRSPRRCPHARRAHGVVPWQ